MLNYLEQLLKEKTDKIGENGKILYSQWQLDKAYAARVLSTIFNIFPHYTLHDQTHSEAILENIGRILKKETFESFSLTDLLLLLYAAFYHDIGMAVSASELDEILKDEKFFTYLREIQDDSKHDFSYFFEISDNKIIYKDNKVSLEKIEALKFILAEYIRQHHGERSKNNLKNDFSLMDSILPHLKERVGEICQCHTEPFEKVMELPPKENGTECGDDGHPRFIACLLRLGDLLDLNSDRISHIILRTVKTIPAESSFHIKKHQSISYINVDSEQIDITAKCKEYKTADLVKNWFSWLSKEITNQTNNWEKIVPNNLDSIALPKIGALNVKLNSYDYYTRFEIDTQKAIEMLQGANLYTEPFQSIREILQNSVDATYLRIWIENKDSNSNMTLDKFKKECGKDEYAIRVKIEKNEEFSDDEKIVWRITIADAGIGMSQEDLNFLYKTGSSSQNKEKLKYLLEMPEYMKPSGIFGIGFQSIFLITDRVHIRTRKYNSGDEYDLDLYNPTGEDNGIILLKKNQSSNFKFGTEVSFDFVDPISDDDFIAYELDVKDILVNAIKEFAKASYQKIKLNGTEQIIDEEKIDFQYYSEKTNLAIQVTFPSDYDYYGKNSSKPCSIFYRNQSVKKTSFRFHFLKISVNILRCNAKKILTLNRNEINSRYYNELYRDTIITVMEYLKQNFTTMSEQDKCYASAFAYLYADTAGIKFDDSEFFTKWKNHSIEIIIRVSEKEIQSVMIGELVQNVDYVRIYHSTTIDDYDTKFELEQKCLTIYQPVDTYLNINWETALLFKAISPYFRISYDRSVPSIIFDKTDSPIIDKKECCLWLLCLYKKRIIPCNPEYIKLAIKYNYEDSSHWLYCYSNIFPQMISPYIVEHSENGAKLLKKDISNRLIDFVYNHRRDDTVTRDEIIDAYEQFIKNSESAISEINNEMAHGGNIE